MPKALVVQPGGLGTGKVGVPKALVVQPGGLGTGKVVYLRLLWFSRVVKAQERLCT